MHKNDYDASFFASSPSISSMFFKRSPPGIKHSRLYHMRIPVNPIKINVNQLGTLVVVTKVQPRVFELNLHTTYLYEFISQCKLFTKLASVLY